MRPKIYLDMDGVMCDFVGRVLQTFSPRIGEVRAPLREEDISTWNIENHLGMSSETLWSGIGHSGFWRGLESYPWSTPLFEMLSFYGDVTYLTSPGRAPGAASGKVQWMQDRHGAGFTDWILTNHKEHVAGPGKILIDDAEKNCTAWRDAGGTAVLFPQYWNARRGTRQRLPRSDHMAGRDLQHIVADIEFSVRCIDGRAGQ